MSAGGSFDIMAFLPLIGVFVVFYFLLIRPQQKKAKEHADMLTSLKRGDKVLTSGGFMATVSKLVSDHEVVLEIADGVRVRCIKSSITQVFTPGAITEAKEEN